MRERKLTAVITFSNVNYVLQADPREDDTFAFVLPGVRFDSEHNVFYAISEDGHRTPIAEFKRVLFGKKIQLLPGATIYARKDYGDITVKLIVTDRPTSASHWREVNGNRGQW
jgi:hypothetical protein